MTFRIAAVASVAIGLVILLPVLGVVGLGAYGESIGGGTRSGEARSAELLLSPAAGPPGSIVAVTGRGWSPKKEIELFVSRAITDSTDQRPRLRVARVVTSRNGTFKVELALPELLVGTSATAVDFEASAAQGDDIVPTRSRFTLEPYPTELAVRALDSASGKLLPGAIVAVIDSFQRSIASGRTDANGALVLKGLKPGAAQVHIRQFDFLAGISSVEIAENGRSQVDVTLISDAGRRLLIPHTRSPGGGVLTYGVVDRASGLAYTIAGWISLPGTRTLNVYNSGLSYRYSLATETGGDTALPATEPNALYSILAVANGIKGFTDFDPSRVSYVGSTDSTDLVFAHDTAYWFTQSLYLVDRESHHINRRIRFGPEVLPPILAADGSRVYVINWFRRTADVLDSDTGRRLGRITTLPRFVRHAALDPTGQKLLMLSALGGGLFSLDIQTGNVEGPLMEIPGVTWFHVSGQSGRALAVSRQSPILTVIDLNHYTIANVVPLENPADWVWEDPEGPFIYTGSYRRPEVEVLKADLSVRVGIVSIPQPDGSGYQERIIR